jgi:toxin-antitoxin system PIN domain toxin
MILCDVNVLIYAFRQDAPQHRMCLDWLQAVVDGESAFAMSPLALAAVVRITTNHRSNFNVSTTEEAFRFCDYLLGQPHCEIVEPGPRHWAIFSRLCVETNTRGPKVTDAWYAALAIEHGCEWITLDRDFARFPALKWSTPAAPK